MKLVCSSSSRLALPIRETYYELRLTQLTGMSGVP